MKNLKKHVQQTTLKLIALLCTLTLISSCETDTYQGKPENTISVKKAKELNNNFNKRYEVMSELIGKDDNRSSWHSLAELEQYIAYIKTEGTKKGLAVDGIRIYFGAYGPNETGREDFSTLFLVPTIKPKATDQNGAKNFAAVVDESEDTKELSPLNFGGTGHPPKKEY
jgi:hypothetical protein